MQSPYSPPPIPSPDGRNFSSTPLPNRGDWKTAPGIVRGWAYPLTWLVLIVLPLALLGLFFDDRRDPLERTVLLIFFAVMWGVNLWHNRALKSGAAAAWVTQIVLSILGLFGFPLGTFIHAYVLSQWFKPETKAWFGRA